MAATEIPHPSNVTDQEQQRNHYFRQIAEQLARIGDSLAHASTPHAVAKPVNITDRAQLQTFNLRQVAIQLARIADGLEPDSPPLKRPKAPPTSPRAPAKRSPRRKL